MSGPPDVPGQYAVVYGSNIREITTVGTVSIEGSQVVLTSQVGRKIFLPLSTLTDCKASKDAASTPVVRKYLLNITYMLENSTSIFLRFTNTVDYDEASEDSVVNSTAFTGKMKYQAYLKYMIQHGYTVKSEVLKPTSATAVVQPTVTKVENNTVTSTPLVNNSSSSTTSSGTVAATAQAPVVVDHIQRNQRIIESREQMLRDPDYVYLQDLYKLTVGARLLPAELFWSQHYIEVLEYSKRAYAPAPTPAQVGSHQFRTHQALTEEDKQSILVERPETHLAYIQNVPLYVKEAQFWQLYGSSQYAKGGNPSNAQILSFEQLVDACDSEEVFQKKLTDEFGRDIFLIASLYLQYNQGCRDNVMKRKKLQSMAKLGSKKGQQLQQQIDGCDNSADLGWNRVNDVELTDKNAFAGQRSKYALDIESGKERSKLTQSLNRLGLQSVLHDNYEKVEDNSSARTYGVNLEQLVPTVGCLHTASEQTEEAVFLALPSPQNLVLHGVSQLAPPVEMEGGNTVLADAQASDIPGDLFQMKRKRGEEFHAEYNSMEKRRSMNINLPWSSPQTCLGEVKYLTVDPRTVSNNTVTGLTMVQQRGNTNNTHITNNKKITVDPVVKKTSTVCIELCRYYWKANESRKTDKADVSKTVMKNVYGRVVELSKSINQMKLTYSKDNNTIARDQLAFIESMTRQVELHWLRLTGQTKQ